MTQEIRFGEAGATRFDGALNKTMNCLAYSRRSRWRQTSCEGLTGREREILTYIAEDKKNKEIADLLGISVRTVQAHRTNLMDKLGAHDRTELVKYAISKGIIDL